MVRAGEGQSGARPEGGRRRPTSNRTLLPKGPSGVTSQVWAG